MSHSILVDHLLLTPLDCVCFRNAKIFLIVTKKGKYSPDEKTRIHSKQLKNICAKIKEKSSSANMEDDVIERD